MTAQPLDDSESELVAAAIAAMANAYCPYSAFPVGCAARASDGSIFAGANVENAAYPAGLCAEAVALGRMAAAGGRRLAAVAGAGTAEGLCTPCGACRQRIREFADADVPILICGPEGLRARFTLGELLPHAFGPEHLGKAPAGA